MKKQLQRIYDQLIVLRDQSHDDEVTDELDNTLLHLESAIDRLVQMDEEEDEGEENDDV